MKKNNGIRLLGIVLAGVIGQILFILYLLCDMSMTLNKHIKMLRYESVSGKIELIGYTESGGAYIVLKNDSISSADIYRDIMYDRTKYILHDRSTITKSDTGKHVKILYHHMRGGRGSSGGFYVKQLSMDQKIVWTYTPPYIMDVIFILFSLVIVYYAISEIYKEVKQNNTLRSAE